MGDRTNFQAYIWSCPDDQRTAAAEVMEGISIDWGTGDEPPPRHQVTDNTLNTDGKPIRRGQEAKVLGDFATLDEARAYIAGLPDDAPPFERYSIDEVADITLTDGYGEHDMSCGSAEEYAEQLIEAAPGCSFLLWEDPAYDWLGSLWAYTPELGTFTAECDANGQPVYSRNEIVAMIDKAAETGAGVIDHIHQATGGPWFAAWKAS